MDEVGAVLRIVLLAFIVFMTLEFVLRDAPHCYYAQGWWKCVDSWSSVERQAREREARLEVLEHPQWGPEELERRGLSDVARELR
jgi:hypothetical protein